RCAPSHPSRTSRITAPPPSRPRRQHTQSCPLWPTTLPRRPRSDPLALPRPTRLPRRLHLQRPRESLDPSALRLCRRLLVSQGPPCTLALRAVRHCDPWDDVVHTLLRQVKKVIPGFRVVLLDRGFYSVNVIRSLQRARYPFIMPVICRGRKASHAK